MLKKFQCRCGRHTFFPVARSSYACTFQCTNCFEAVVVTSSICCEQCQARLDCLAEDQVWISSTQQNVKAILVVKVKTSISHRVRIIIDS